MADDIEEIAKRMRESGFSLRALYKIIAAC